MTTDFQDQQDVRILMVEDNPIDVRATLRAAERLGIADRIHVETDGSAALAYLRDPPPGHARPTLVLLDLELPGKNGREVLAEMKADDDLRLIPVVILTTSSEESDVSRAYELGASAFVSKPVGLDGWEELAGKIEGFWLNAVRYPSN